MAERIDILVALKELSKFVSDTRTASKSVAGVGEAAEKTGEKAKVSWKQVAKWGGVATAAYGAQRFLRGAVSATEDLGKSTLTLHHVTGMDIHTSSQWAAMMNVRGQNTRQASMAFIKVSQALESARQGTAKSTTELRNLGVQMQLVRQKGGKDMPKDLAKLAGQMDRARASGVKATSTLRNLGVSQQAIRSGNTQEAVLEIADAFKGMENPARRAALTQKLFGRTGRELLPLLLKGRKGIEDQLHMADRYGATFSDKGVGGVKEMIASQRELKLAMLGVKVQMGQALLPVIESVVKVFVAFAQVLSPLTKNSKLLTLAIVALTTAFLVYKAITIAATIAQAIWNVELGITAALITGGVVIGIIALIAVIYLLIKHWGWVKRVAADTWGWIKAHYPLLLVLVFGPFGIAITLVIKHFGALKRIAADVFGFIKQIAQPVVDLIRRLVDWAKQAAHWLGQLKPPGWMRKAGGLVGKGLGAVGLQHGGAVTSRTSALVGEAGPELVSLPAGATVAPLSRAQTVAFAGAGGGTQTIVTKVFLDRRQIAQAVGTYTADKLARR